MEGADTRGVLEFDAVCLFNEDALDAGRQFLLPPAEQFDFRKEGAGKYVDIRVRTNKTTAPKAWTLKERKFIDGIIGCIGGGLK